MTAQKVKNGGTEIRVLNLDQTDLRKFSVLVIRLVSRAGKSPTSAVLRASPSYPLSLADLRNNPPVLPLACCNSEQAQGDELAWIKPASVKNALGVQDLVLPVYWQRFHTSAVGSTFLDHLHDMLIRKL